MYLSRTGLKRELQKQCSLCSLGNDRGMRMNTWIFYIQQDKLNDLLLLFACFIYQKCEHPFLLVGALQIPLAHWIVSAKLCVERGSIIPFKCLPQESSVGVISWESVPRVVAFFHQNAHWSTAREIQMQHNKSSGSSAGLRDKNNEWGLISGIEIWVS